jgi:hypothetical protein
VNEELHAKTVEWLKAEAEGVHHYFLEVEVYKFAAYALRCVEAAEPIEWEEPSYDALTVEELREILGHVNAALQRKVLGDPLKAVTAHPPASPSGAAGGGKEGE